MSVKYSGLELKPSTAEEIDEHLDSMGKVENTLYAVVIVGALFGACVYFSLKLFFG